MEGGTGLKLLFHYMGRHLRRIGLGITVKVAAAFLELLIPYVLEYIIDRLAPQGRAAPVIAWGLVMAGLAWSVRWGNIFAAQRVSSIMGADLILVLEDGRITGAGRHGELLERCPVYRDIYQSQMGDLA